MNSNNSIMRMNDKVSPDARAALLATQWPIFRGEPTQMLGFQAVLKFLRHIYSYLPEEPLKDASSDPLLVLQLAGYVPDEGEEDNVKGLKKRALGEICPDWESGDRAEPASFLELIEGDKLISRLWSRRDFLLYNPRVFSLDPGAALWAENDAPRSAEEIARHSLVKYDGTRPIWETVSELFGPFMFPTGYKYMRLPLMPLILRVLYTPTKTEGVGFDQLQSFSLVALNFEPKDDARERYELRKVYNVYQLAAIVRLRANPAEPDLLRMYDQHGTYIIPFGEGGVLCNDDWRVGQHGHSYMLMYVSLGANHKYQCDSSKELVTLSEESKRNIDRLRAAQKASCRDFDPKSIVRGQSMSVQQGLQARKQGAAAAPKAIEQRHMSEDVRRKGTLSFDLEANSSDIAAPARPSSSGPGAFGAKTPFSVDPWVNHVKPTADLRPRSSSSNASSARGSLSFFTGPLVDKTMPNLKNDAKTGERPQEQQQRTQERRPDGHFTGLHPERLSLMSQRRLSPASKRSPYSLDYGEDNLSKRSPYSLDYGDDNPSKRRR